MESFNKPSARVRIPEMGALGFSGGFVASVTPANNAEKASSLMEAPPLPLISRVVRRPRKIVAVFGIFDSTTRRSLSVSRGGAWHTSAHDGGKNTLPSLAAFTSAIQSARKGRAVTSLEQGSVRVLQAATMSAAEMTGGAVFFVAGVRLWKFGLVFAAAGAAVPIAWSMLRPYQQKRIFTFLDPETDPLGAGYNILQSKIALGSGGVFGKGFMQGSQSHLNFLPEKQTDFIFTMLAEELGMFGGLVLLGLYILMMVYGFAISLRSRNHFGRLLAMGITCVLFLFVFINIAMVMGLIPVVGVPLPLISYGGTAMLTLMIGMGFLICTYIHRDVTIPRHGGGI